MDASDADLAVARELDRRASLARADADASGRDDGAVTRRRSSSSFDSLANALATPADVDAARASARARGVFERDLDRRGVPVPGSERRFSVLASHRGIGASSVSLALYLDTALQFGVLVLVLAAASMYSLAKNVMDEAFTASYEVRGWDGNASATATCGRAHDTGGFVLRLSQGSRCVIGATQSFYNCPMVCEYTGANGTFDAANACATHYPCTLAGLLTDAQDALCCQPKLINQGKSAPAEFQAVSLVITIVFLLFDFAYTVNRTTAADIIKSSTVTMGDYSVIVSNLGKGNSWTREQIARFFSHYGEVVSVCHLTNTAKHVALERKIQEAVKVKGEIDAILDAELVSDEKVNVLQRVRRKLFRVVALGGMAPTLDNSKRLQDRIDKLRRKVVDLGEYGTTHLGSAIVTFNYEQHALNCIADHCNDKGEQILAQITRKNPPDFNGRRLVVTRAPEPSDINWQNLRSRQSNREIVAIWIYSKLLLALGLGAGGGIQYFFEYLRRQAYEDLHDEVAMSSTYSTGTYLKLQLIASLTSLVVVIVNFSLDSLTVYLAKMETYKTRTTKTNVLIAELTLVNLLNYVIIPIITNRCSSTADGVCNWYVPGGFMEVAFWMQTFNVLALPFRVFSPWHYITSNWLAPMAKTLQVQEDLVRPPSFGLARSYAELLKTVGFAAIYAPAIPSSYLIGLVGIFVLYWCKKYQGLFIAEAPPKLREDSFGITATARIINLLQILFGCLVFYRFDDGIYTTLWANIGVWAIALIPIRTVRKLLFADAAKPIASSTGDVSFEQNAGLNDEQGKPRSMRMNSSREIEMPKMQENRHSGEKIESETRAAKVRRAFICRMYRCTESELNSVGRVAMYYPPIPTHASPEQLERLLKDYEPFPSCVPANTSYLPGQTDSTGGAYAEPPMRKSQQTKLNIMESFRRRKRMAEEDSAV